MKKDYTKEWTTKHEKAFVRRLEGKPGWREKYLTGLRRRRLWGAIDREELREWIEKRWGVII